MNTKKQFGARIKRLPGGDVLVTQTVMGNHNRYIKDKDADGRERKQFAKPENLKEIGEVVTKALDGRLRPMIIFALIIWGSGQLRAQSFIDACLDGDLHRMQVLYNRDASVISKDQWDVEGYYPLDRVFRALHDPESGGYYYIPEADNFEVVTFLLDKGADPNHAPYVASQKYNYEGYEYEPTVFENAVSRALENGSTKMLELLLAHGANVNHVFQEHTPLENAIMYGGIYSHKHKVSDANKLKIEAFLINHGANITRSEYGFTLLHRAAQEGDTKLAELLLKNGADVNARNNDGDTPLYFAIKNKHSQTAALLKRDGGVEE